MDATKEGFIFSKGKVQELRRAEKQLKNINKCYANLKGGKMIELVCMCKRPADRIKLVINSNRLLTDGIFREIDLRGGTYKLFGHCRSCKRDGEIKKKNNLTWRSEQGSGWKELRDKKKYRYEF